VTRVVIDAMGGEIGVGPTVAGAAELSLESDSIQMILVGDARLITETLGSLSHDSRRIQVAHSSPVSTDGTTKTNASIEVAMDILARGGADALVTAGHTDTLVAMATDRLKYLPGIRRAALAAVHPTEQRHGPKEDPFALLLDVGATQTASAEDLVSFAVMGSAYAQIISANPRPSVALLSNGKNLTHGTPAIQQAHEHLSRHPAVHFVGNVEGLDLPRGSVDVVVCDGFVGSVVFAMLEGVTEVVTDLARDAYARKFLWRLGLTMLSQGLRQLRVMTDWRQYGGAPLLGFESVIIKADSRSNARAIRNAIRVANKAIEHDLSGQIRRGMMPVD